MTRHDPSVQLRHMLDHAKEAVALLAGRNRSDLGEDRLLELALVRLLEVVGEAANRIDPADRSRYPSVPWNEIIGMRHRLIHGYDAVDLNVLWNTVQADLPDLIRTIQSILEEQFSLSK